MGDGFGLLPVQRREVDHSVPCYSENTSIFRIVACKDELNSARLPFDMKNFHSGLPHLNWKHGVPKACLRTC
jgi:hypothetical protein